MEILKKLYPTAFKATDVKNLVVALIVFVVIDVICGAAIGLLAKIPLIGVIFSILGSIIGLYAFIGIVLSVLVFLKILND